MNTEVIIVEGLAIQDLDGSNRTSYELTDSDSINFTHDQDTTKASSGQTIKNYTNAVFEGNLYDLNVLNDSRVGVDATIASKSTLVILTRNNGEIQLYGVRINGKKQRDTTRQYAEITCSVNDKNGFYNQGIGIWTIEGTFKVS